MVVKRKVSLSHSSDAGRNDAGGEGAPPPLLDLFFDTGLVYADLGRIPLPDIVCGFMLVRSESGAITSVKRATAPENADVELSPVDHVGEFLGRWLPIPYQLSCPLAVQVFLGGGDAAAPEVLLAVDTRSHPDAGGRLLDVALDQGRPFRPLDGSECAAILDRSDVRDYCRALERCGIEKAPLKLASLWEALGARLPRLRLSVVETESSIPVSLVLDFGNSRSSAVLVEQHGGAVSAIPLSMRSAAHPLTLREDNFDSRITFYPPTHELSTPPACVGYGFAQPSIVRMGREALDRALETPHRYQCTLSGPKRYLWDGRPTQERWHFALQRDGHYSPIAGRALKYLDEASDGLVLRKDGPSTPGDPRYAPRAAMLFALVEILTQAYAHIASPRYGSLHGKEGSARVLRHLVLTYPSAMCHEEKEVYETLARNAVMLTGHILGIPQERWPSRLADGSFEKMLYVDEALAAQMVFVYQEVSQVYAGNMEDMVAVYGRRSGTLRIASVDIGGGTTDVTIADYRDMQPGAGTSLAIEKVFQDGVSIAGDDVCRALVEEVVIPQVLANATGQESRTKLAHLLGEHDAKLGAVWRTLRAKLVPYFWLPLARAYWAVADGVNVPDHSEDKVYSAADLQRLFPESSWSLTVVEEADRFLCAQIDGFPGLSNVLFRLDRLETERAIEGVLREPLRRYADIIAQFDADLLLLTGRASTLPCIHRLFVGEMPVAPARIKPMVRYRVSDWYPANWRASGFIRDPKSTVAAGAMILHLAGNNRLPGFSLDHIKELPQTPIFGVYQDTEPHILARTELFRNGKKTSDPIAYTHGMRLGFRLVDSEEMDGTPLYEVLPRTKDVEAALLEDRVSLSFRLGENLRIEIVEVVSQRGVYQFSPDDFELRLRTLTSDRYWLDTGIFRGALRHG